MAQNHFINAQTIACIVLLGWATHAPANEDADADNPSITNTFAKNLQTLATASSTTDTAAPNEVLDFEELWEGLDHHASETKTFGKAKLSLEYQFDTRGFNTLNLTGSAPLPGGWNIWGFVDFESPDGGVDDSRTDLSEFFFEIDLKRKVWNDFGVVLEVNDPQGVDNALSRVGLFWTPKSQFLKDHNLFFFVKVFPYESDGRGYQISFAWNKKFPNILDGRFSVGGFFDANFENGPGKDKVLIVSDTQFRYRLVDGLHFLAEVRVNEFFDAKKDVGVGFGFQYYF